MSRTEQSSEEIGVVGCALSAVIQVHYKTFGNRDAR